MRRPVRVLGALLTLSALSASFAEGVWASTCAGMEMDAPADGMAGMDMSGMDMSRMDLASMPMSDPADSPPAPGAPPQESDVPSHQGSSDDSCPLVAVIGGCVQLSVLPREPRLALIPAILVGQRPPRETSADLLFVSPLLRPPRA